MTEAFNLSKRQEEETATEDEGSKQAETFSRVHGREDRD